MIELMNAFNCDLEGRDAPDFFFVVVFFLLYVLRAIFIPPL